MIKILRKTDIVLIVALIVLAVALLFIFALPSTDNLGYVLISVDLRGGDGRTYLLNLEEYEGREFEIISERGRNVLIIENGAPRMIYADCRDDVCINMGSINRSWHQITCLPNRVAINLIPPEEDEEEIHPDLPRRPDVISH
jgi:hypothetical protein